MPLLEIGPEGISVSVTITRCRDDTPVVRSTRHAANLAQARVEPGHRVLEIGSGGPLASMLAHLVGPDGQVVTVDIDDGVTARVRAGLERLGLTDRVEVVTADAAHHLGRGTFDRIMVTVSPWAIPRSWLEQLAPDGVLVVPLRVAPGMQRVIGFRHENGHLVSESVVGGGFVFLQGVDQFDPPSVDLTGPSGHRVTFRFSGQVPEDFAVSDDVLASTAVDAWSGAAYASGELWLDLLTWTLVQPGGCAMEVVVPTDRGAVDSFYPALVDGSSFASVAHRSLPDGTLEIGAVGKGPEAARLTARLAESLRVYDTEHRGVEPLFQWWPADHPPSDLAPGVTVLPRPHGTLTITWLPAGR
ncbi:methyltransferase, FxLD system [Antribacter gilvus]|uniref:methyltransferase, FxLD system n=1 Tax=Antribacter gilvus TaxID=2304675 RepID=UPI000F78423C|nr:methyltransferase, FxLD system [Antribacter gilvus]